VARGEKWSDDPKTVHRAIRWVARSVNDDVRQTLWPLILASLDTARPDTSCSFGASGATGE